MDSNQIDFYLMFSAERGVTTSGLNIIREIITNPPARRVNSRALSPNITCRFPSRKMGFTIQAESQTLELPTIYLREFDPAVKGYWDQPFHKPDLNYKSGNRKVRVQSTLDFFVIGDDFIGFEECKPSSTFEALAKKHPGRYHCNPDNGLYEIPPLIEYLAGTGLSCRVVTDKQINPTYINNLACIYDLVAQNVGGEVRRILRCCREFISMNGCMTIEELEAVFPSIERINVLIGLAQGELFTDLNTYHLDDPERVYVGASLAQILTFSASESRFSESVVTLTSSPREIEVALQRYKVISYVINGKNIRQVSEEENISVRTIQRWLSLHEKNGLDGLSPRHSKKGNYLSKLPEQIESLIENFIDEYYLTNQNKRPQHVFQLLVAKCKDLGLLPPSRKAFNSRVNLIADADALKIREGAKSAYQKTAYSGMKEDNDEEYAFRTTTRFLERCHIDHTVIDVELLSDEGGNLGRPVLTTIIDEYSGYILAIYLSFRNPSVIRVMCAIRLMVRKHSLFPEAIVYDGGKEFESIYFEKLMAKRFCTAISRKGKARGGVPVERSFGTLNTIFLENLNGSTLLTKNVRQLSSTHDPKKLAVWKALDFNRALIDFVDKWNVESSKSAGLSPTELRDNSIFRFGLRDIRKVEFDSEFVKDMLLPPKRSTTVLRRGEKVQVNRVNYWNSCLQSIPREGVKVDILYDPFNLNYIFIHNGKEWIRFRSTKKQHRIFDELDNAMIAEVEKELLYINEKKRESSRSDFAVFVEDLNQSAIADINFIENSVSSEGANEKSSDTLTAFDEKKSPVSLWDIDIPSSTQGAI